MPRVAAQQQARLVEQQRLADEARAVEQQRLADQAKLAFEQQRRDEQQSHDDEIFRPKKPASIGGAIIESAPVVVTPSELDRLAAAGKIERRVTRPLPQPAPAGMNDPEVFARAVATVVSAVLGERGHAAPQQVIVQSAPVPVKQGFWASARHLDVLLLGLTTMIVLVVLAAWLA